MSGVLLWGALDVLKCYVVIREQGGFRIVGSRPTFMGERPTKICVVCNHEFLPRAGKTMTCSKTCAAERKRLNDLASKRKRDIAPRRREKWHELGRGPEPVQSPLAFLSASFSRS